MHDITPAHCHQRALRLLATLEVLREEMGRPEDPRPQPEITGAKPREVYFQAIAAWHKATRLADELHACSARPAPAAPSLEDILPGHVHQVIDAVLATVEDVAKEVGVTAQIPETALELTRQPSDVLAALLRANRALSRLLERPMAPSDVYRVVALSLAYARRTSKTDVADAPFARAKRPADCYAQLETVLGTVAKKIAARGGTALNARVPLSDINPTDVYDLANIVLGEVAYLHSLDNTAKPVHSFEPGGHGRRLPAHVFQLARTLDAQLASI